MRIQVECTRHRGELEPYLFWLGGRRLHVARVVARSVEPTARTFTVCVDDGRCFVLTEDLATHAWQLTRVIPAAAARARSS